MGIVSLLITFEMFLIGILMVLLYFTKSTNSIVVALKSIFSYRMGLPSDETKILVGSIIPFVLAFVSIFSYFYADNFNAPAFDQFPKLSQENWIFLVIGNIIMVVIFAVMVAKSRIKNKSESGQ
jgi:hypothetical protein